MKVGFDQNQLLAQLHKLSELAKAGAAQPTADISGAAKPEFGNLLTKAIDNVNQLQMDSGRASANIESGDGGVSLVKAMIASQKANVAFQATVQVRNKVVSAYQDIMNMPI
jgi:flagellar hook-basal body complex protein FliE